MGDNIKTYPKVIYLLSEEDEPFGECHEISWCEDEVNNNDIKYIRADLSHAPNRNALVEVVEDEIKYLGEIHLRLTTQCSSAWPNEFIPNIKNHIVLLEAKLVDYQAGKK